MGPLIRAKKPETSQFIKKAGRLAPGKNPQGSSFDRDVLIRRVFLQDLANQLN
ncbi:MULTISPECIES: hypothetical protein [unclassified Pseudomonas]|uniref:hypothetical protein n=1 Tax=unclassified Pseudomonas TaxID=196821 RepID=UPI00147E198D|nr:MULTISPECIES: hypothetical protein [unclassified Pseudomonas]